jgi:DNA-binding response OmpR family regulator
MSVVNEGRACLAEAVAVLAVSPHESELVALRHIFGHSNWRFDEARNCPEAAQALESAVYPVIICENELPDGTWKTVFEGARRFGRAPSLIVSTRSTDERLWGEVLNLGGYDVLTRPFVAAEVFRVSFLAWHSWRRLSRAAGPEPAFAAHQRQWK